MSDIKKEILEAIGTSPYYNYVVKELDMMEKLEGLDEKPILQKFYNIWKSSQGKVGQKNDINSWTAFALGLTSSIKIIPSSLLST